MRKFFELGGKRQEIEKQDQHKGRREKPTQGYDVKRSPSIRARGEGTAVWLSPTGELWRQCKSYPCPLSKLRLPPPHSRWVSIGGLAGSCEFLGPSTSVQTRWVPQPSNTEKQVLDVGSQSTQLVLVRVVDGSESTDHVCYTSQVQTHLNVKNVCLRADEIWYRGSNFLLPDSSHSNLKIELKMKCLNK